MKKFIIFFLLIHFNSIGQEKIYGEFYFEQSKKDVKKIFKINKSKYQNITFAGQDFYIINKPFISSFNYIDDKLQSITLFAKKVGKSNELQSQNIKDLDRYFLENGFSELFRQTHWDTPVFYDNAQNGVVYHNTKSNSIVILSMRDEVQLDNTVTAGSLGEFRNNHTAIKVLAFSTYKNKIDNITSKNQKDNSDF